MKHFISILGFMVLFATSAIAGDAGDINVNSASGALSGSYSGIYSEGTHIPNNTPGLGAAGTNSTAECIRGHGAGIVLPGFGINYSNGVLEENCNTRAEAYILRDLTNRRPSAGRTSAMLHFCLNDESMARTLSAMGNCPRDRMAMASRADVTAASSNRTVEQPRLAYRSCRVVDGALKVRARAGSDRETAKAQCAAAYRAGQLN